MLTVATLVFTMTTSGPCFYCTLNTESPGKLILYKGLGSKIWTYKEQLIYITYIVGKKNMSGWSQHMYDLGICICIPIVTKLWLRDLRQTASIGVLVLIVSFILDVKQASQIMNEGMFSCLQPAHCSSFCPHLYPFVLHYLISPLSTASITIYSVHFPPQNMFILSLLTTRQIYKPSKKTSQLWWDNVA